MSDFKKNPYAPFEDKTDFEIPTATLEIYRFIEKHLARDPMDNNVERGSSAPYCPKRRWYSKRREIGDPLTPRKNINFLLGNLSESVMLYFIVNSCVGSGKLYSEISLGKEIGVLHYQEKELKIYEQEQHEIEIDGEKVTTHVEGWGKRNSDGKWEHIECKSASNWGFNDFKKEGPGDYLKQAAVALQTKKAKDLGATETRFFFLRKETGHIWDALCPFDPALWQTVIEEYRIARQDQEPEAPFPLVAETFKRKPTGRIVADFPCTYCPFLKLCHGDYTLEWKSDQFGQKKPIYVFNKEKK